MRWLERLSAAEERCIAGVPPSRIRQARAAVRFAAGIAPWGIVFAVIFAVLGQRELAISLAVAGIGVGLVPAVVRGTGSVDLAAHWFNAFLVQSLLLPAWLLGGLLAACVPWLAVCVVVATFLSGVRAGLVWALIDVACAGALLAGHLTGAVPEPPVPEHVVWMLAASAHAGLFAVVLVLVAAATAVNARARRDLESARVAADEANEAKSSFLARMSHELRTPMNAVIGYAELLLEEPAAAGREELERIRAAGQHLLGLVNDLLDLSKVDAGAMPFTCVVVDVTRLAEDVLADAGPLLGRNGNRGVLRGQPVVCAIADPMRLRQCLLNLVGNAAKFTRDGEVAIEVDRRGDRVIVAVRDTGTGIAPEHLSRIFEPFAQATPHVQGGTGLGLALVRQFAERMGGRVDVESAVGVGSTFSLDLPAAPAQQAVA